MHCANDINAIVTAGFIACSVIRKDIVLFLEKHNIISRGLPVSEASVVGKKYYCSKTPTTKPIADSGDAQKSSLFLFDKDTKKLRKKVPSLYELLKTMSGSELFTVKKASSSYSSSHQKIS